MTDWDATNALLLLSAECSEGSDNEHNSGRDCSSVTHEELAERSSLSDRRDAVSDSTAATTSIASARDHLRDGGVGCDDLSVGAGRRHEA